MFKKSFVRSLLSAAIFTQALTATVASANTYPPDADASPKPGEQHPTLLLPPEANLPTTGPLEHKSDIVRNYGNFVWGGGYRLYSNVRAPSLAFQSVNAVVEGRAKLFGTEKVVFSASTGTWNPNNNQRSSRITISLADKEIFNQTKSSELPISTTTVAFTMPNVDKEVFDVSKGFGVGPFSVKVKGTVHVTARANLTAEAYRRDALTSGATFTGTAFGRSYASLSASVDAWLAEAGVRGNVDFVKLDANLNLKSERAGNLVNYDTSFIVSLCSLGGDVEVFVEAFGADADKTILDWDAVCLNRDWGAGRGTTNLGPTRAVIVAPIFELQP